MVGIPPTLMPPTPDRAPDEPNMRYQALNDSIFTARARTSRSTSQARTAQCTPRRSPRTACTSGGVIAPSGRRRSSPTTTGTLRRCWLTATRPRRQLPPYFSATNCGPRPASSCSAQATDTRPDEFKAQGVALVWFGERWITRSSICSRERAVLRCCPNCRRKIPSRELAAGRTPRRLELRLHNGIGVPAELGPCMTS